MLTSNSLNFPSPRHPSFSDADRITRALQTMILQDIAVQEGIVGDIRLSFSYKQKVKDMVSSLLYDAYLKHLASSAPIPDSSDVKNYYEKYKQEKYLGGERVVVREIRVKNKSLADSLLGVLGDGESFLSIAKKYSLTNPGGGGEVGPFTRNDNKYIFDAAMLLDPGSFSPVVSTAGGQFAIVQLVKKLPSQPADLEGVYIRIESLLIKENQNTNKTDKIEALFSKYSIIKNLSLLK